MILTLLAAISVQSSPIDDCAILEAITPPQAEANGVSQESDDPDMTRFSGIGLAVMVDATPLLYASRATLYETLLSLNPEESIPAERVEELFVLIDRWRQDASQDERLAVARGEYAGHADFLRSEIGDIPDGLIENFIAATTDDTPWNCPTGDFSTFSSHDGLQLMESLLPYGTGTRTIHATRPGYSNDGNWALTHISRFSALPRLVFDDGSLTPSQGGGSHGYILMAHDESGNWTISKNIPVMIFN